MGMIGNTLALGLVSGANIQDGTVDTADIKDGAVTTSKLADGAVVTADIANGAVTPAKLSTGAPTWDTSGNVGIGTSSPASLLDVRFANNPATDNGIGFNVLRVYTTASQASGVGGAIGLGGQGVGALVSFAQIAGRKENSTAGSNSGYLQLSTLDNGGTMAERARITSSGDFLIGTATSSSKLTVAGAGTFLNGSGSLTYQGSFGDGASAFNIQFWTNTTAGGYMSLSGAGDNLLFTSSNASGITMGRHNGHHVRFSGAATQFGLASGEAARITSAGNIGVGTTSPSSSWSGDSRILQVVSTVTTAAGLRVTSANASGELFASGGSNEWGLISNTSSPFTIYTSGVERMRIDASGVLSTANGMPITSGQVLSGSVTTDGSGNAQIALSGWSWGDFNSYRRNIFVMLGVQGGTYLGAWIGAIQHAGTATAFSTTSTNASTSAGTISFASNGGAGTRWFQLTGLPANTTFSYALRGIALTESFRSNYGAF